VISPLNREGDEQGSHWSEAGVTAPEGFKDAYSAYCEGGWNGLGGNPEYGGMGMPKTLIAPIEEMVQGSCIAFGLMPMLTAGATLALNAHADETLKSAYLPKMYTGEWAGAMDLTEPHCGTDLGMIRTKAVANTDGSFSVTGTKIFITWGDHDLAENIIHLVLAKLPDAPAGSKGISMFLVPKFLPDEAGGAGERNAVSCGSIEKKMGIKASATCVMNFDGAKGWLVGEENKGLAAMFTMMNYERLAVGIQGIGVAEKSYQTALSYAKERIQGRSPSGPVSPDKAADNLLVHADVRRMLLTMKSFNEAGRAFYVYLAKWLDLAKFGATEEQKDHADQMTALLTPISKAFMTDVALESAVAGQQVLGGHGYVREWGQEQHIRDIRITQIYEGTNGIQAMDLVGRKTVGSNGQLLALYYKDIEQFLVEARACEGAQYFVDQLSDAMVQVNECTSELLEQAKSDVHAPGSAAVDYLDMVGYLCYGHMWTMIVVAALKREQDDFARSKLITAKFYFTKLMPKIATLRQRIAAGSEPTMALAEDLF